ncbi:pyridoxal phosphate-dependent decarboxylase family protein [Leisingera aquimarina]|nr:aminotransferase class V-fold PLP-dependent enzyme [Leisingera aquimarina]
MTQALDQAATLAKTWLEGLDERKVNSTASLETLRSRFSGPLPANGEEPETVVQTLARDMQDGLLGSAGGRFFAWVIGGGLEAALAADWLVSTWDQNAALYACGPAAAVVEEQAGIWLKELFDLPRDASFAFTTGCQLAHMTSLAAARHAVLKADGWDVEENGLIGAPDLKVLVNDQKHGSIRQAVNFLGLGQSSLVQLKTDSMGRVLTSELEQALSEHKGPKILVLNAADLNIGAFDDYRTLIPMAKNTGAWVHIDGAFGLFARTSAKYSHLADGLQLADSWATDGHKWLNVPFDCGVAIIRDQAAHKAAMTIAADYIAPAGAARDQIDWNPEWSRRARGVPVYAALKQLGRSGIEDMIDRCCAHCQAIVRGIGALDNAHVVFDPQLNQGLVRFARPGDTGEEGDLYTKEIMSRINATGEAFFSDTVWQGRRAMRVSVVNWRTNESDITRAIEAAQWALQMDKVECVS